ncbi:MAG: molybdenum cofactor biosynthesis protein MoaE, partial [Burkholderiales bacterium]|nr:molybdenum cofactor biosynthesis protein MoaE [Burkholderiales bacterium]
TELSIARMIDEAKSRFDVLGVRVIHRVGALAIADQIVLVAVSSAHRGQAFQCCEFLMDWLKTDAPFWKKELVDGQGQWVDAREADEHAMARWRQG